MGAAEHPAHPRDPFAFADDAPAGWFAVLEASFSHVVTSQTVMQPVKRGELCAVHVRTGRRRGLRVESRTPQNQLFQG